ncbi:fructose-bisphosphate aldolase [Herbidospora galbida]|uniref:Fructose-bisphosphate aldolase n=1 Tax=Herbidospora galbida TaxID=2575442 RepID=A0A4U3MPI0_9ACTN|nr:fructose-bisphosphate aldolase [Herbidospora galbida]TKK90749.1 fructose-bisphosphate aldolase [Herbidospora galbida]
MSTHWPRRRMHHVFAPDGRAVIAAMDAGITKGVAPGLERGRAAVKRIVDGGVDAILATIGLARAAADELGGTGLILALDSEIPSARYGVEQAVRWGADALELKVFPGNPEVTKMGELRELCAEGDKWGMPVMAEPIPVGFKALEAHTLANIAHGARVSAEAGADFVKAQYTGTPEEYREVVEGCLVPVLALGGPMKPTPLHALQMAYDAIQAGAGGIVYGRNIVEAERPDRMVAALVEIVHGGASVDVAAKHLNIPL